MIRHIIRKGHDIPLAGAARETVETAPPPVSIALRTADITGFKFNVHVNEGEPVKPGQVLCHTRQYPDIRFRSPAGGIVREILRGERRALHEIIIAPDAGDNPDTFRIFAPVDPDTSEPETIRAHLLDSGLWPFIQQRPLAKISHPGSRPAAIFINAMATAPLAAQPHILLHGREDDLAAGIRVLSRLNGGKTYVCVRAGGPPVPGVDMLDGVETHAFSGPHPAGCPGVHIQLIQPLKRGETAWCIPAVDAADIGYLFRTGRLPLERVIALAGSAVADPKYYRVRSGCDLASLLGDRVDTAAPVRFINGDVLAGKRMEPSAHLAGNQTLLTVIPEGTARDFMGWGMPGFARYSAFRTFASSLLPRRKFTLDTRLHGGVRAIVDIGQWYNVLPFDIHLSYLIRAVQAGDIQEAENLGLLELSEEDVALCAFVDPSKTDVCGVIRKGLDLYEAENA
jgi:Na+-transporting NADH:ubiquinone oxidoreductase subunit A